MNETLNKIVAIEMAWLQAGKPVIYTSSNAGEGLYYNGITCAIRVNIEGLVIDVKKLANVLLQTCTCSKIKLKLTEDGFLEIQTWM